MRKRLCIEDKEMKQKARHGKQMTAYEDALFELMLRLEEGERYLQRSRTQKKEMYVTEKKEETDAASGREEEKRQEAVWNTKKEPQEEYRGICRTDVSYVKLTAWEWMEARKSMLCNILLLLSVMFLQIYIVWTDMNLISHRILQGMKYCCVIILSIRGIRWIRSGELRAYLNEEN